MDHRRYTVPAFNTLTASWWTLFCAGLFGRRETIENDGGIVILDRWRGKTYLVDYRPAKHPQNGSASD